MIFTVLFFVYFLLEIIVFRFNGPNLCENLKKIFWRLLDLLIPLTISIAEILRLVKNKL